MFHESVNITFITPSYLAHTQTQTVSILKHFVSHEIFRHSHQNSLYTLYNVVGVVCSNSLLKLVISNQACVIFSHITFH